ncbi:hypothetical protein AMECASPLE_007982 [Ameca splendens]|uniref:Uncharacterized protein n=1 Tax=Ameca splendens TaxID=208324 RepID=A0ABV0XNT0_9TELE
MLKAALAGWYQSVSPHFKHQHIVFITAGVKCTFYGLSTRKCREWEDVFLSEWKNQLSVFKLFISHIVRERSDGGKKERNGHKTERVQTIEKLQGIKPQEEKHKLIVSLQK